MADGGDQAFDPAVYLAGWTRLSPDDFKICYKSTYPRGSARSWEELVVGAGAGIIRTACLEAARVGFLDRLTDVVGKWEADAGRSAAEIADMLRLSSSGGIMQAIINQATGFLDPKSLLAVYDAFSACAMVLAPQGFRGTAFLVRPDMVLTAAHVVLDVTGTGDARTWSDKPVENLIFSFRPRDGMPMTSRVQVRAAAKNALVACSKPWGKWPNLLNLSLTSTSLAGPTLDYALVRLAQRVEHLRPVAVDPPANVEANRRCWTTGYPGGSAGVVDIDVVVDADAGGGRWLHKANAVQGMSGSCCINDLGKLAGIHEGCVNLPVDGQIKPFNRGISIAAIRAHQRTEKPDPMQSRVVVQGVEFEDAEMVGELYRAGQRLAEPAFAPNWDGAVRAVLGVDPSLTNDLPAFHPWFTRNQFEDWIRRSAAVERLCFVSGARGAGASFCKQILKARLDPSGIDYLEINPTQVAAFSPREAITASSTATPSPNRTSAANFRYNDANDLIAQLSGGQYIAGPKTIAIDFGSEGGPGRLIGTSWQEFILRLLSEEAIRLVLIGLTADEQAVLHDILLENPATDGIRAVSIQLVPVTADEFETYAGALADARGVRLKTAELRKRIEPIVGRYPYETPGNAALQTAFFALAAIILEAGLES